MQTPWLKNSEIPSYPDLNTNISADVCVIGGGICGLTTALLLQKKGLDVVLLERSRLGQGVTGHTSGHVTSLIDAYYHNIISRFSEDTARTVYDATVAARELVEQLSSEHEFDAGFERVPAWYYATNEEQMNTLKKEREALHQINVSHENGKPENLPFSILDSLKVPAQAMINTGKYVSGIARAFSEAGGRIYENTAVLDFDNEGDKVEIKTTDHIVQVGKVVQATHTPIVINPLQLELKNLHSYVLAGRASVDIPDGLYYDLASPYRYIRPFDNKLIVGGFDSPSGSSENEMQHMKELEEYSNRHFGITQADFKWSHVFFSSPDGLPFIGEDPVHENSYVATGFAGDGLTFSLVSAMLNSELISSSRDHHWKEVFNPSRLKLKNLPEIVKKSGDMLRHLFLERFQLDGTEIQDLHTGEGKILNVKGQKLGLYLDDELNIYAVKPVCNHMQCVLNWNSFAKTWDCHCHGSRYNVEGNPISGPATTPLESEMASLEEWRDKGRRS